ncbi:MAG: MBL fold metallo-hydrolase [Clostridia bacterium]|nr:MBL fold metallo-hydrolase [Clostridia bacterium]
MKLEFLGTGAADYDLERDSALAEFRRFSSMMINDDLLIDPGPHIFHYAETFGKEHLFDNLKTVIITHSHEDHLDPESVKRLSALCPDCVFAGNAVSLEVLQTAGVEVNYRVLTPFERYEFGNAVIVPMYANHFTGRYDEQPLLYSVELEGKKLYYGADTGWLPAATWEYISTQQYDAMIFELTVGEASYDYRIFTHMGTDMLKIMLRTVTHRDRHYNATNFGCKFFTTHHARTLHPDHATLAAMLAPLNVLPAYDGFITEI